jgi:hypothetical protein
MLCMRPLGCARAVIAAVRRTRRAPVERGRSPLPDRSFQMPLILAQKNAWNVVVFQIADRTFGVAEAGDYDGDPSSIVREYDPFAR